MKKTKTIAAKFWFVLAGMLWLPNSPAFAQPGSGAPTSIVAAVLPSSRSVQVGTTATAFATIINAGTVTATSCGIELLSSIPANFSYQTTDSATNALIGRPDTPVNIAPGRLQTYVFSLTPNTPIEPIEIEFSFDVQQHQPGDYDCRCQHAAVYGISNASTGHHRVGGGDKGLYTGIGRHPLFGSTLGSIRGGDNEFGSQC